MYLNDRDLADVATVNQEGIQDQILALEELDPSYQSVISVTKSALPLGNIIVLIRAYSTFKRTEVSWLHCYLPKKIKTVEIVETENQPAGPE